MTRHAIGDSGIILEVRTLGSWKPALGPVGWFLPEFTVVELYVQAGWPPVGPLPLPLAISASVQVGTSSGRLFVKLSRDNPAAFYFRLDIARMTIADLLSLTPTLGLARALTWMNSDIFVIEDATVQMACRDVTLGTNVTVHCLLCCF